MSVFRRFEIKLVSLNLVLMVLLFSTISLGGFFQKTYPQLPINQQNPDSSWGAVYSKSVSTRVVTGQTILSVAYEVTTVNANPGEGPFSDVSQTYLVDYNRDGRADIFSVTYGGRVIIKRNDGVVNNELRFTDAVSYIIWNLGNNNGSGDGTAVVDDFDNDGTPDLFLFNARQLAIFIPNASVPKSVTANPPQMFWQFFNSDPKFRTNWTVSAMVAYDYDGDGYKDIIYADMSGRIWLWKNIHSRGNTRFFDPNGRVLLFSDPDVGTTAAYGGAVLDLADVDDDGVPDLVVGHTDKRNIFLYPGKLVNQQLVFDPREKIALVRPDGDLGNLVSVDPTIPNSKNPKLLPSFAPTLIKVIDVDRDGIKDIFIATDAWRQGANFGGSIYLFKGRGRTTDGKTNFVSLELVRGNYSSSGVNPYDFDSGAVGDIDNDGIPDFVAADGNHSGNYYKIVMTTNFLYVTEAGFLVSFETPRLVGIPLANLRENFTKRIEVTVVFANTPESQGTFSLRYAKSKIRDPRLIDPKNYTLFPGTTESMPIPPTRTFAATVEFSTPVMDPQVIITIEPPKRSDGTVDRTKSPQILSITYKVWTEPAQVQVKRFQWMRNN